MMMRATTLLLGLMLAACATASQPGLSVGEPSAIQWGSGVEAMKARLTGQCEKMTVRPIKPPFLTAVKDQQQIDCEGFNFFGRARHAEFVIGDDSLEMVWVMIDPGEYDAALKAMTAAYGASPARREDMIGWPANRTALRSKPAEFLFYSPRQAAEWEDWYRKPAAGH
jgi:hypothetical protein